MDRTNWREVTAWVRRQNHFRLAHASKVWATYHWQKLTDGFLLPEMPLSLSIETGTACNLRCPECPSGLKSFTRPQGKLNLDFFRSVLDEVHPWLMNLNLYFQGEPLLHPEFHEFAAYASSKNIFTRTSTNGHFLDESSAKELIDSGIDSITVSVDGITQEVYESYRIGGNLGKVLEGIRNLSEARKKSKRITPVIRLQFLVTGVNEHQLNGVRDLASKVGADRVDFKSVQVYDFEKGSRLISATKHYARYQKTVSGNWTIKNDLENHCWRMWSGSVITWDGKVVPCCFDKDAKHSLGNLQQQSFRSIWKSEAYNSFRISVLKSRRDVDICANCTEGLKLVN